MNKATARGTYITKAGAPMIYGITIIKSAPHYKTAIRFIDFILNKKGRDIIKKNGQSTAVPSPSDTYESIPDPLKKYALEK